LQFTAKKKALILSPFQMLSLSADSPLLQKKKQKTPSRVISDLYKKKRNTKESIINTGHT